MSFPTIKLTDVLQYLENPEPVDKPFLFVNPSEDLYTFFKYKGNKIDILKDRIKLDLDPEQKDKIIDNFLNNIEAGMALGGWAVLNTETSASFDILEYLKRINFCDKEMFKPSKIHDKKYCLKQGLLRKEHDVDFFGNRGYFEIKDKFKLCFLSACKIEEINAFLKSNENIEFNVIIVE